MARGAPANGAIRPPALRRCSPGQGGVGLPVQWSPDGRVPIEVGCCISAWVLNLPARLFQFDPN